MVILPNIGDGEDKSSPFTNCIRNNYRHIRKWAKRTSTDCFRIYDRHLNTHLLAIDYYAGRYCIHYFAQNQEEVEPPQSIIQEVELSLNLLFRAMPKDIFWRTRQRTKTTRQYEKTDITKDFFTVQEYGVKFRVNLQDYLDTGLFLDHRETRQIVASHCSGKKVLNLFAYTAAFSVHACVRGAIFTKSVDMSNTYCAWARENFLLNSLPTDTNVILRADCMKSIIEEHEKFDVIVIDPPTISRSKKMEEMFDIQIDYISLINRCLHLLNQEGVIFFSMNSRKFKFDEIFFLNCTIQEITHKTLPIDFHDPKIHRCWKIKI